MGKTTVPSPSGRRDVELHDDRALVLLNCRHWMQPKTPLPTGTPFGCGSCHQPRIVVESLTAWQAAMTKQDPERRPACVACGGDAGRWEDNDTPNPDTGKVGKHWVPCSVCKGQADR
jgi:hypothetical protein